MRWGDEPFVDGEEEEERWRGEDDGERWISRTWRGKCDLMKKEFVRLSDEKITFILLDSSACPGYLWPTPSDTAPDHQEGVELVTHMGDKYIPW